MDSPIRAQALAMPHVTTDDGVRPLLLEACAGLPDRVRARIRGDWRSYRPIALLSRRYRCLAFNARGYPPSAVPRIGRAIRGTARDDHPRRGLRWSALAKVAMSSSSRCAGLPCCHFGFALPGPRQRIGGRRLGYGAPPDKRSSSRGEPRARGRRSHRRGMPGRQDLWRRPTRCSNLNKIRAATQL